MEYKTHVSATEFKKNLGQYLDMALSGETVHITKHGGKRVLLMAGETSLSTGTCPDMRPDMQGSIPSAKMAEEAAVYVTSPKTVSYAEFMEIYENTDERLEFINGEISLLASPSLPHQLVTTNLLIKLYQYLDGKPCRVIQAPFDITLCESGSDRPDVCQPDLLVACDLEGHVSEKGRYFGTPTLVVEVLSPSTRSKDLITKLNVYMRSGVREYWVIDPLHRTMLSYSFQDTTVLDFLMLRDGDVLQSTSLPEFSVSMEELFKHLTKPPQEPASPSDS